jgi:hypothetical protein
MALSGAYNTDARDAIFNDVGQHQFNFNNCVIYQNVDSVPHESSQDVAVFEEFRMHSYENLAPPRDPLPAAKPPFFFERNALVHKPVEPLLQRAYYHEPLTSSANAFVKVFAEGDPGNGIGGYDLKSRADIVFPFDYNSSGKNDHIVLYRPGTGTIWILHNDAGIFEAVYAQGDPGNGIGGYDLRSPADRAFAFDYDSSGKLDHIVLYRPGTGTIWILRNNSGIFIPVYRQGDPGSGIGGYDLQSAADRAFAFDYNSSGKLDHLALYRPGTGIIWIMCNNSGNFIPVYRQGDPGNSIDGYNFKSSTDRFFAFDYNSSGKLDHLVLYRPGTGTIWILHNNRGIFTHVYQQGEPGHGIAEYDLKSPADHVFAFDYNGSGKLDHLVLYRPGTGTIWIVHNVGGIFSAVYQEGDPGKGIGGYDLRSGADCAFPFDYLSNGRSNHLGLYRPGTGTIWLLKRVEREDGQQRIAP